MSEHKKFEVEAKDGKVVLSLDTNQDGEKVLDLKIQLGEAAQELLKRGEKIEGAKKVDFSLSAQGLVMKVDTDQDGESVIELNANFMEALDEAGVIKN